jgi:response regulator RpfG family c-di-GMP phosphodiesterase
MQGMNGFTLIKKLKSIDKKFKGCFLTAFEIEKEDFSEQHHYRHHWLLKKPILLSDFIKKVNSLLKRT